MEKKNKILIPNDFSVKSLVLLKAAIESAPEANLDIILLHGIYLTDSITELMFFKKNKFISELETTEFRDALNLLKSKFQSRLNSLTLDIITSNNRRYFKNYLQSNSITQIYAPSDLALDFNGKYSFDIVPLLKKNELEVKYLQLMPKNKEEITFTNQISDLFFNNSLTPILAEI